MAFVKGKSGNAKGRPKGIIDKRTEYRKLFQSKAPELIEKAIEMALEGDSASMRLCMERIAPAIKAQDLPITLPDLDTPESLPSKGDIILKALGSGQLTPGEASTILTSLANQAKLIETDDLLNVLKNWSPYEHKNPCGKT